MSTSCTIKTCWNQASSLSTVAAGLKKAYDNAKQVNEFRNSHNTWRFSGKSQKHFLLKYNNIYPVNNEKIMSTDLVYIDSSPDFCSPSQYGPGTGGRECSLVNNTCSVLCCGRGYSYVLVKVSTRCKCVAKWCCEVKCEECVRSETRLQCNE